MEPVIFGVRNRRIHANYDRTALRLGAIVHVTFDQAGDPTSFTPEPTEGSVPHCVTWIAPSEWYVPLDVVAVDDHFRNRVHSALNGYLSPDDVDAGLDRAASHVRLGEFYRTAEVISGPLGVISGVVERLDFIRRLDDHVVRRAIFWHWEPLCVYLALTCFDLLGQPPGGWRSMRDWLEEARVVGLPEEVSAGLDEASDPIESGLVLAEAHEGLFGVRRSFFRFIREVLPEAARRELLNSTRLHDTSLPPTMRELPAPGDEEKERYLYATRNNYTHRARFVGGTGYPAPEELGRREDMWVAREQTITTTHMRSVFCRDWPGVLTRSARVGLASFIERLPAV